MLPAGRVTTSPCGTSTAAQSRSKRTGSLVWEYMLMGDGGQNAGEASFYRPPAAMLSRPRTGALRRRHERVRLLRARHGSLAGAHPAADREHRLRRRLGAAGMDARPAMQLDGRA